MPTLSFLTPVGALVALSAALPLVVFLLRERRGREIRGTLGLTDPAPGAGRALLAALIAVPVLTAFAAAQPVVDRATPKQERVDAEILFVFDTTRSMHAAAGVDEPTRFDRARRIANEVRAAFPEVRAGIGSLTDRVLPHLFPTSDGSSFRSTLARSISIERPPPVSYRTLATDLNGLAAVGQQGYFSPESSARLLIVLSDGESERVRARLPVALRNAGIERHLRPGLAVERVDLPDLEARARLPPGSAQWAETGRLRGFGRGCCVLRGRSRVRSWSTRVRRSARDRPARARNETYSR